MILERVGEREVYSRVRNALLLFVHCLLAGVKDIRMDFRAYELSGGWSDGLLDVWLTFAPLATLRCV